VLSVVTGGVLLLVAAVAALMAYLVWRYGPVIERIFKEPPMFLPPRVTPEDRGQAVRFPTEDGLTLAGNYLRRRRGERAGLLVFCHEYLSDRWSYLPYLDHLRDDGFDLFIFDFRNHGESDRVEGYAPLQWVTDHEVRDLRAALGYLRTRPDHDPAGFGLVGISRGGGTALATAADERDVWGVITDGAFATHGTMTAYIIRWSEIYVRSRLFLAMMPMWIYHFLAWVCRRRSARMLNCRFPDVERGARRIAPRPLLMIHGERDTYIGPEIARNLFDQAREPKEMWLVPDAKHNRCRECQPAAYRERIGAFLARYAPRRTTLPEAAAPRVAAEARPARAAEPEFAASKPELIPNVTAPLAS
jgi:pimeloyl-ACP methyl ester carboxylesterase